MRDWGKKKNRNMSEQRDGDRMRGEKRRLEDIVEKKRRNEKEQKVWRVRKILEGERASAYFRRREKEMERHEKRMEEDRE